MSRSSSDQIAIGVAVIGGASAVTGVVSMLIADAIDDVDDAAPGHDAITWLTMVLVAILVGVLAIGAFLLVWARRRRLVPAVGMGLVPCVLALVLVPWLWTR